MRAIITVLGLGLSGRAASAGAATSAVPPPALDTGHVLSVLLGLLIVLATIAVLAWALRHLFRVGAGGEGFVQVLGSTSLGARERVVLLQVGGEQILVGVAPGRVQTLHVLDEPVTLPAPGAAPGFQAQLARFLGRPAMGERSEVGGRRE